MIYLYLLNFFLIIIIIKINYLFLQSAAPVVLLKFDYKTKLYSYWHDNLITQIIMIYFQELMILQIWQPQCNLDTFICL